MFSTPLPGYDTVHTVGASTETSALGRAPKFPSTTTPESLFWHWLSQNIAKVPMAFGTATLPLGEDSTNWHFQGNAISKL